MIGNSGLQYDSISLENDSPVNKDLVFNKDMTHIYVMTSLKVCIVLL